MTFYYSNFEDSRKYLCNVGFLPKLIPAISRKAHSVT